MLGATDAFSNFRVYRKDAIPKFDLKGGGTFGVEFLVIAKKGGLKIGEIVYKPRRRRDPRIGSTIKAS